MTNDPLKPDDVKMLGEPQQPSELMIPRLIKWTTFERPGPEKGEIVTWIEAHYKVMALEFIATDVRNNKGRLIGSTITWINKPNWVYDPVEYVEFEENDLLHPPLQFERLAFPIGKSDPIPETPTKESAARRLVRLHYKMDPAITLIRRLVVSEVYESLAGEPIKLLEVKEGTIEAGIMPVYFGPNTSPDMPYRCIIVEITPAEYALVLAGILGLPDEWRLGNKYDRSGGVIA